MTQSPAQQPGACSPACVHVAVASDLLDQAVDARARAEKAEAALRLALALLDRWLSQHRDGGTTDPCGVAPELVAETRDAVSAGTLTSADNGRR